ncbi:unnamed protein product [Gulo gulo]|uniref:Uncharacterized protein n=1 Tax=Gulo gulo TaxID=48420 RepID=A0A9X9Q827_GULGU|nr:unnamed protein product [Gulo gulo]
MKRRGRNSLEPTCPSLRGWIRRCLPSAGLPSLLLLPLAITAGGPQGHEMSATGQVRHLWA